MLVAVDWAALVGVKMASLGSSWERWIELPWLGGITRFGGILIEE
jgi:hypothetical protein